VPVGEFEIDIHINMLPLYFAPSCFAQNFL
jgi:hypothetical protein